MLSIIKFYIIEALENICEWILMTFSEKLCFEKEGKNGNKMKGGNKDAL